MAWRADDERSKDRGNLSIDFAEADWPSPSYRDTSGLGNWGGVAHKERKWGKRQARGGRTAPPAIGLSLLLIAAPAFDVTIGSCHSVSQLGGFQFDESFRREKISIYFEIVRPILGIHRFLFQRSFARIVSLFIRGKSVSSSHSWMPSLPLTSTARDSYV